MLRSGCRLVVAPMFHLPVDWSQRLQVESGSEWRAPDAGELALLLPEESRPIARENLTACLCLFQLPRHLLAAWWRLVDQLNETGQMPPDRFDAFTREVGRFLAFKELVLPKGAAVELLISQPGPQSPPERMAVSELWGGINLGDRAALVEFINLPAHERCPDYSTLRLRIEPGEGYRFPAEGWFVGVRALDEHEPTIFLRVRQPQRVNQGP